MIKILVAEKRGSDGLKYYRHLMPHRGLMLRHNSRFHIDVVPEKEIYGLSDEVLRGYQLVFLQRADIVDMRTGESGTIEAMRRIKSVGVPMVLDVDDWWELNKEHPLRPTWDKFRIPVKAMESIALADFVIVTTPQLADKVRKINPNVEVLKNVIDPDDPQWHPRPTQNARVRFGWVGGVFHRHDIALLADGMQRIRKDTALHSKIQLCVAGFNVAQGNQEYIEIEKIVTDGYKLLRFDDEYRQYLFRFTPQLEHYAFDKPYRRLWAKPVHEYGTLYNELDVALIPLQENAFNACKSELKLLEAGTMRKAAIVSDVLPYSPVLDNGFNCFKAFGKLNWYAGMRRLTNEPAMREDLAAGLAATVAEHFNFEAEVNKRAEVYTYIVEGRNK